MRSPGRPRHQPAAVLLIAAGLALNAGAVPIRGVDLSFAPQVEAAGAEFQADGVPGDLLTILADHGVTTVRLRLWRRPADGHSGLAEVLAMARRVRAAGLDLLLDLHFSDTWADPGHQRPPSAWQGLPLPALADSVRAATRQALQALDRQGTAPAMVQLGNEITSGILWDHGRVGGAFDTEEQWRQLARLLNAALAGIDDALPADRRPEVMLHLDRGGDNGGARWFLDHLAAAGVAYDVIGLSYYPWWHGTLDDLESNLRDLARRYGKDLLVVETSYPWTLGWFDDTHNLVGTSDQLLPGFAATPDGQRRYLEALLAVVEAVPRGRGRGVCWWAPEWIARPGCGSAAENLTLFDPHGQALPALQAFLPTAQQFGDQNRNH